MKPIMVLGIGNILMGDDGIGVYLVNDLSSNHPNEYVEYLVGETDVSFCIEMTRHVEKLIIVDAVLTGKKPGEVAVFSCKRESPNKGFSMHNLHFLEEASHMGLPWEGTIIGVEVEFIGFQLGLSSQLQDRYSEIIQKVKGIIQDVVLKAAL